MGSGAGCLGGARGKRASRGPPLCWGAAGEPGCPLGVPGAARTGGFCAARGKRWEKAGAREWRLRSCTRADWPASGSRRGAWARRALGAAPPGAPSWSLAAQGLRGRTRQRSSKCVCVCVNFSFPFPPMRSEGALAGGREGAREAEAGGFYFPLLIARRAGGPPSPSGPGALGGGEDAPSSCASGWAQGARKLDGRPGHGRLAELAARVACPRRWEPWVRRLAAPPEARGRSPGAGSPAPPEPAGDAGKPETRAPGRPSARAGHRPQADAPGSQPRDVGRGGACPQGREAPSGSRAGRSSPFARAAVGPAGPTLLCVSGTEAGFQRWAGLRALLGGGKQPRLYRKPQLFFSPPSPGLEWKLGGQGKSSRSLRAWGEALAGALVFPRSPWPSPPAFVTLAPEGFPLLEEGPLRCRQGDLPASGPPAEKRGESTPLPHTHPCCPRKDSHTQVAPD